MMKRIKVGQIGIGHNHGEPKLLAVRKFPELFEVVGYAEENERWVEKRGKNKGYEGLPRLSVAEVIERSDAVAALKKCRLPVIFFHGTADDYVPWEMSQKNYDACPAEKELICIPGAGHGLSYLVDPPGYLKALREFGEKYWGL